MSRDGDSRDRSAHLGATLVGIGVFIKYFIPEPYNDIIGKVFIGLIVFVLFAFFAFSIYNERRNEKESTMAKVASDYRMPTIEDDPQTRKRLAAVKKTKKSGFRDLILCLLSIAFLLLVCYFIALDTESKKSASAPKVSSTSSSVFNGSSFEKLAAAAERIVSPTPTATRNYEDNSVPLYYQRNYPATWGYIKKYSSDPYTYVKLYDLIWGDLQEYHGDGIVFNTLSWYEQTLVHYPGVLSSIYLSSYNGTEYHSLPYCYSLLRSSPVPVDSKYAYKYEPCSKCVGR